MCGMHLSQRHLFGRTELACDLCPKWVWLQDIFLYKSQQAIYIVLLPQGDLDEL